MNAILSNNYCESLKLENSIKSNTAKLISKLNNDTFNSLCRTCLSNNNVHPIESTRYEKEIRLTELIEEFTKIQVLENKELPQKICESCASELYKFYIFKKQILECDILLKEVFNTSLYTTNCKVENVASESVNTEKFSAEENLDESLDDTGIHGDGFEGSLSEEDKPRKSRAIRKRMTARVKHKCRNCSLEFHSREELKAHQREAKHQEVRNHSCNVCHKRFTSSKLRQHMRVHTKEKPFQCYICLQCFSMSGNLKRHMMTHTGERPHVCNICGKGFIQATSLQSHEKTHASSESFDTATSAKFVCNICGRCFKRLTPYGAHLKKHDSKTAAKTEIKCLKFSGEKTHVCTICQKSYKTRHLLKAHALTHGEKSFLCSECGKGFVTKAALQSHLKVHTGEKPHTCSICKKSFAHVGSFESHMLIHTGQKPYNCDMCSKAFTQLSHLKYHLRTHSGERPYVCSYCGKTFALKGNLTVHIRTHTGETPYLCTICGKGFYDSSSMKKHRRSHGKDYQPQSVPAKHEVDVLQAHEDDHHLHNQMSVVDEIHHTFPLPVITTTY